MQPPCLGTTGSTSPIRTRGHAPFALSCVLMGCPARGGGTRSGERGYKCAYGPCRQHLSCVCQVHMGLCLWYCLLLSSLQARSCAHINRNRGKTLRQTLTQERFPMGSMPTTGTTKPLESWETLLPALAGPCPSNFQQQEVQTQFRHRPSTQGFFILLPERICGKRCKLLTQLLLNIFLQEPEDKPSTEIGF
jgi:hypothetical protein